MSHIPCKVCARWTPHAQCSQLTESEHSTRSPVAMLDGLLNGAGAGEALPFVLMFYGAPSVYLWEDDVGDIHTIHQGEGGEQGDALIPFLFALGQHSALDAIQENLEDGEHLFAFHDDTPQVPPNRVGSLCALLQEHLYGYSRIRINGGRCGIKLESGRMHATFWSVSRRNLISKHGCGKAQVCLKRSKG